MAQSDLNRQQSQPSSSQSQTHHQTSTQQPQPSTSGQQNPSLSKAQLSYLRKQKRGRYSQIDNLFIEKIPNEIDEWEDKLKGIDKLKTEDKKAHVPKFNELKVPPRIYELHVKAGRDMIYKDEECGPDQNNKTFEMVFHEPLSKQIYFYTHYITQNLDDSKVEYLSKTYKYLHPVAKENILPSFKDANGNKEFTLQILSAPVPDRRCDDLFCIYLALYCRDLTIQSNLYFVGELVLWYNRVGGKLRWGWTKFDDAARDDHEQVWKQYKDGLYINSVNYFQGLVFRENFDKLQMYKLRNENEMINEYKRRIFPRLRARGEENIFINGPSMRQQRFIAFVTKAEYLSGQRKIQQRYHINYYGTEIPSYENLDDRPSQNFHHNHAYQLIFRDNNEQIANYTKYYSKLNDTEYIVRKPQKSVFAAEFKEFVRVHKAKQTYDWFALQVCTVPQQDEIAKHLNIVYYAIYRRYIQGFRKKEDQIKKLASFKYIGELVLWYKKDNARLQKTLVKFDRSAKQQDKNDWKSLCYKKQYFFQYLVIREKFDLYCGFVDLFNSPLINLYKRTIFKGRSKPLCHDPDETAPIKALAFKQPQEPHETEPIDESQPTLKYKLYFFPFFRRVPHHEITDPESEPPFYMKIKYWIRNLPQYQVSQFPLTILSTSTRQATQQQTPFVQDDYVATLVTRIAGIAPEILRVKPRLSTQQASNMTTGQVISGSQQVNNRDSTYQYKFTYDNEIVNNTKYYSQCIKIETETGSDGNQITKNILIIAEQRPRELLNKSLISYYVTLPPTPEPENKTFLLMICTTPVLDERRTLLLYINFGIYSKRCDSDQCKYVGELIIWFNRYGYLTNPGLLRWELTRFDKTADKHDIIAWEKYYQTFSIFFPSLADWEDFQIKFHENLKRFDESPFWQEYKSRIWNAPRWEDDLD